MPNLITHWLRSLGILPRPLTPEQYRQRKLAELAWLIRADRMNALYAGTGRPKPFDIVGRDLG